MPARPDVPNVIQTTVSHLTDFATSFFNRWFWLYTGTPPNLADIITLATNCATHWTGNVQKYMSNETSLQDVTATDLSSSLGSEGSYHAGNAGTATSPVGAMGTSMLISHHISRRYRGGHPRTYIGGLPYDQVENGVWNGTELTNIQTGWAAFVAAMLAESWSGGNITNQVNVSYYEGFTNHTYPSGRVRPIPNLRSSPVIDVVISHTVHDAVASQRRRNPPS